MPDGFTSDAFIKDYIKVFEARDAPRVASFYNAPCLSVRADGSVHSFADHTDLVAFFTTVLQTYADEGMSHFQANDMKGAPLGNASYQLDCTWTMSRADYGVIRAWKQTYIFQNTSGAWKIVASIFHL